MKKNNVKYIHEETVHNLRAPQEIVPVICTLINPKSVVDVGCGVGTFLHCFKNNGVENVLGIDGAWVDKKQLYKNIAPEEFKEQNLEQNFTLPERFDLVVSIEVAEHISSEYAEVFVKNLVQAGDVILFSAAVPQQGGQNHVNEQWLEYWTDKFSKHDYVVHDVLKPFFWNNPDIFFWYKQNMVLVTRKDYVFQKPLTYNTLKDVVHKDMFTFRMNQLTEEIEHVRNGKLPFTTYCKYLLKSLITKK